MKLKDLYRTTSSWHNTAQMPVLFLGHGSPMNAIEENEFVQGFRMISRDLPKPTAILCISAHWETKGTYVTAMDQPRTIHDFGGFPKALYEVEYPAPGSPKLAQEIQAMVPEANVGLDHQWGLDHGAWSVIRHLYPAADVPVFQMSLDRTKSPQYHYELGQELAVLRRKGVLVVGSGNLVHNLRMVAWDKLNTPDFGFEWALEARGKMNDYLSTRQHDSLIRYESQGRSFQLAIPTPEHYLPMLYALALQEADEKVDLFNDKAVGGAITMTSFKIG